MTKLFVIKPRNYFCYLSQRGLLVPYNVVPMSECFVINCGNKWIFCHCGPGSNPGEQKLVTLLMSPKDFLFYAKLFLCEECKIKKQLNDY